MLLYLLDRGAMAAWASDRCLRRQVKSPASALLVADSQGQKIVTAFFKLLSKSL